MCPLGLAREQVAARRLPAGAGRVYATPVPALKDRPAFRSSAGHCTRRASGCSGGHL